MKSLILIFILQLISLHVSAEIIKDKIHSLEKGEDGQPHIVKLLSGRVAFIEAKDKSILHKLEKSIPRDKSFIMEIDSRATLLSLRLSLHEPEPQVKPETFRRTEPYKPSVVSSSTATSIFNKMRKNYQNKSQCFNRAHIWTYEEFMRSQTNFNKVFLFFTSRYIRAYRFHWWFHVTPMLYVGNSSNWKMLDRRYTKGPLSPRTWTNIFMKNDRACKIVHKYSEYRDFQDREYCYMIPVSMYNLVPSDIARTEETGQEKIAYDDMEVEYAYWEAFGD